MKIIIYCAVIINNDAIGNDILIQYDYLKNAEIETELFAISSDPSTQKLLLNEQDFIHHIQDTANILIIHFGTFWKDLSRHLALAKCKVLLKYHNITPGYFFAPYNKRLQKELDESRNHLKKIISSNCIDFYWSASNFNAQELKELGVPENQIFILSPFHKVEDFDQITFDPLNEKKEGVYNLLFVGRVAPNKGHWHLIEILQKYKQTYGNNVHLHIIGSIACELRPYYKALKRQIKKLKVQHMISFCTHVSFTKLNAFYKTADVFVLMSEHEGFCVPILEAQYNRVPILALNRSAIQETLGPEQLLYDEVNYDLFASAIQTLTCNQDVRNYLIERGWTNYQRYTKEKIAKQMFLDLKSFFNIDCKD